jgi:hypothetical protein
VATPQTPARTPDVMRTRAAADPRFPRMAVLAAIVLMVVGMMLVIGGVLVTGLFLPGVVLIGLGMLGFAVAAVLAARSGVPAAADDGAG